MARVGVPPASLRPSDWTAYMAGARVSSALLLFGLLLLVQYLKRGQQLPDRRQTAGLLIGAGLVTLSASVAPDFVTMLLVALLVIAAIDASPAIIAALGRLQSAIGITAGGPTPTYRGGLQPAP
jgi:hypothetical protein